MKTLKHSTAPKKVSKKQARREMNAELSVGGWKDHLSLEIIITKMLDLCLMLKENPKMITLGPWLEKHDLAKQTVDGWRYKYPEVQYLHTKAKNIMSQRIQEKSFYKICDGNFARFCLPNYDEEFIELEKWRNSLKKELSAAAQPTTINVITPDFPSSGKVPDRIKKD